MNEIEITNYHKEVTFIVADGLKIRVVMKAEGLLITKVDFNGDEQIHVLSHSTNRVIIK